MTSDKITTVALRIVGGAGKALALLALGVGLVACESVRRDTAQPVEHAEPAPPAEARASYEDILRQMSERLASSQSLTVTAERHLDGALIEGSEVAEDAEIEVAMRRPDRVHATTRTREGGVRHLYFDGRRATVFDETANMYATEPVEGTTDDLTARLSDRFGFAPPLAEFISSDPLSRIREQVQTGSLGEVRRIEGRECQELDLTGEEAEAELWVGTEDQLPCRLSVTFTALEGRPQMRLEFRRWDLMAELPDERFEFEPPADARQIEMMPLPETRPTAQAQTP